MLKVNVFPTLIMPYFASCYGIIDSDKECHGINQTPVIFPTILIYKVKTFNMAETWPLYYYNSCKQAQT